MNASRADHSRRVDWSAVKGDALAQLVTQVMRFVGGIRGPRQEGVSRKQILAWFSGTPEEFVEKAIGEACAQSKIRCCMRSLGSNSRANGAHVYVVDEPTEDGAAPSELAADAQPAAPSPPMATSRKSPKRRPGTTGAPGGIHYSTPNDRRNSKNHTVNLDDQTWEEVLRQAEDLYESRGQMGDPPERLRSQAIAEAIWEKAPAARRKAAGR